MNNPTTIGRVYRSRFDTGPQLERYLLEGRIIAPGESARAMIERVVAFLADADRALPSSGATTEAFAQRLGHALDHRRIVFSTPIMTNAGRHADRPLAACAVPPVDLRGDLARLKTVVDGYHRAGMGTGFALGALDDPVAVLRRLNQIAVDGAASGAEDRPVGNMALLPLTHPAAEAFIACKVGADQRDEEWRFNISLTATDADMRAAATGRGRQAELLRAAAEAAHACADPGLVFSDRLHAANPAPHLGEYVSTAPCAEVGLVAGETCQFGYINLGAFHSPGGSLPVDVDGLSVTVALLVRALDDAIEASLQHYPHPASARVMRARRKIGVGVCGLADLLLAAGLPYDSFEARRLAQEVIALVNYASKVASMDLARARGGCIAVSDHRSRYADPDFLGRFATLDLDLVPAERWETLARQIAATGMLRNSSTVALPPTGRSSPVIGASTGIEPLFLLTDPHLPGGLHPAVRGLLADHPDLLAAATATGKLPDDQPVPDRLRALLATATQIPPAAHLAMAASVQACVDEAVSKTINLPATATADDIHDIWYNAWEAGCKGVTVYRDTSRSVQPKAL